MLFLIAQIFPEVELAQKLYPFDAATRSLINESTVSSVGDGLTEGLTDADGLPEAEADGLNDADGLNEVEAEGDTEALGLRDDEADGDTEADGETLALGETKVERIDIF